MPRPPPVTIATRPSSITRPSPSGSREQVEHGPRVGAAQEVLRALVEVTAPELLGTIGVAGEDQLEELLVRALAALRALALGRGAAPAGDVHRVVQLDDVVQHLAERRQRLVAAVAHEHDVELLLQS